MRAIREPKKSRLFNPPTAARPWSRLAGCGNGAMAEPRGGNRYVRPKATAPHLDSTKTESVPSCAACPLYPRLQTSPGYTLRSVLCQQQKSFRIAPVDRVGLKIASGRGKEWCANPRSRGAFCQIADSVFTFGGPTIFHVDQQGRPICRVRL